MLGHWAGPGWVGSNVDRYEPSHTAATCELHDDWHFQSSSAKFDGEFITVSWTD